MVDDRVCNEEGGEKKLGKALDFALSVIKDFCHLAVFEAEWKSDIKSAR